MRCHDKFTIETKKIEEPEKTTSVLVEQLSIWHETDWGIDRGDIKRFI
jgi:hypothetical protein